MFEAVSPLRGAVSPVIGAAAVTVSDRGVVGMITLRGDLAEARLRAVCTDLTGAAFPDQRQITRADKGSLGWMSPDEVLLVLSPDAIPDALARMAAALEGVHHLAVDVTDARAVIGVDGAGAREVLAKLTPADLHPQSFGPGELRRTQLGQIAAALWAEDEGRFTVVCFRSVADYAFRLLSQSAQDGPVGHF
jgi:sarcosine oxidase, subunit gamma